MLSSCLAGCTTLQRIDIEADNSGSILVDMHMHEVLRRYLSDLYAIDDPSLDAIPLFDVETIRQMLASQSSVSDIQVWIEPPDHLRIRAHFDRIGSIRIAEANNVISVEDNGDTRRFVLRLTSRHIRDMLKATSLGNSLAADVLVPAGNGVSATEYSEYIGWALEEYADPEILSGLIAAASIDIALFPDGEIIEQRGGRRMGDHVIFAIPLVHALTMQEPLIYWVAVQI